MDSKRKNPAVSQMKHTLRVSLSALTPYSSSSIASPLTNIQKYSPCDTEVIKWGEGLDICRGGIYFLNHCHYGSDQKERGTGTGGETSLGTIVKERDEVRKERMIKRAGTTEWVKLFNMMMVLPVVFGHCIFITVAVQDSCLFNKCFVDMEMQQKEWGKERERGMQNW